MPDRRQIARIDGPVDAVVAVPGSKSIANRALVCAALADGSSTLSNVPDGDDTIAMVRCLRALGVATFVDGTTATIVGTGGHLRVGGVLHAGLAGTTSRFVTALASLAGVPATIDGDPPLRARPFSPLFDALRQLGCAVDGSEAEDRLPAVIVGPPTGDRVRIAGDVSSQFLTALMLIGPVLPRGLNLALTTPLISIPYVEMTASVMAHFGVDRVLLAEDLITVPASTYTAQHIDIEPDASSASYALAMAAVHGGSVRVPGLARDSIQGDHRLADLLQSMGCHVEQDPAGTAVHRTPCMALRGVDVDMADISDLVPTMAAVAAVADTPTRIRGVGFIRNKESDRLGDLAGELRKLGVHVAEHDDGLEISPSRHTLRGGHLRTHHDHRLAMAFAVVGSACGDVTLDDGDVVTKSWPGFWSAFEDAFG